MQRSNDLHLPEAPQDLHGPVKAWSQPVIIPTYLPQAPDRNPMFLEKRVYQGSSGKVYPLPFTDRIAEQKTPHEWQAVHLENEFIRLMILPQIGGRIHVAQDKTNGYDIVYRQDVIKPALVGLAGPWISGGIEFNWPQHHRPGTFMPADWHIEEHADGSRTIWLSEHDPMNRLKGMHGVCLHPGRSVIELKARLYNRTPFTQTFLWWANVATRVHERYQSFFPPDVFYVADHAKRAMSRFPLCEDRYYGVDYAARGRQGVPSSEQPRQFVPPGDYAANDLSWYANIPVPTSYMCMGTKEDFFGGYDHAARAGILHVASHHVSPGKKQWTWGNHEFGYAWDRNLTDPDHDGVYHPYIELMAGVFTDNQPDFSFLAPGETRAFSQFWYPLREIGPADHANVDAAISLRAIPKARGSAAGLQVGVHVSAIFPSAIVRLTDEGDTLNEWTVDLSPAAPFIAPVTLSRPTKLTNLRLSVLDRDGREIISYQPKRRTVGEVPAPATEPPAPGQIESIDELYITGLHLEQYRHATRMPELYWRETLRRDPLDSRCNNAMSLWHLRRGEFEPAERHFRRAIERLTRRNPNPRDGEPFYNLGLALRYQSRFDEAYEFFHKSAWNVAWQSPAYHAIAEIDCRRGDYDLAIEHLDRSLRKNADNLQARDLKALALRKLDRLAESDALLHETLAIDPLDFWARDILGQPLDCDDQVRIDIALDYERSGFDAEAVAVLKSARSTPIVPYLAGMTLASPFANMKQGDSSVAPAVFPSRLEEMLALDQAIAKNPKDAEARYLLGLFLYDRRRHEEAIGQWERSAKLNPKFPTVWRNLGIGYFNIRHDARRARQAYEKAFAADPTDARVLYERDQLAKRLGESPSKRLKLLDKHRELIEKRDDLSAELAALLNQVGRHADAQSLLANRNFQPWEGGEGVVLGQHVRTQLALGRIALSKNDPQTARKHFEAALHPPQNLGEARHLLANSSDIHYWLGEALAAIGDKQAAREHWTLAAEFKGDFQDMSVRLFSEMTYYSALSLQRLGRGKAATRLLKDLLAYARQLRRTAAKIDYFATSLPTMLVFDDDVQRRQAIAASFLEGQALLGLKKIPAARKLLTQVLKQDPNHALAADLLAEKSD